jgi:glycerol uptake facilitator-like aquaporin
VLNSVLGISWFWFYGSLVLAQLPVYARDTLGGEAAVMSVLLAVFAAGIGVGSLLCEKLSGHKIEIGLVPLGAIGLSVFGIDLYFAQPTDVGALGQSVSEVFGQPGRWRVLMDLALIGLFGGFFIVPLFALIQSRTPREEVSRVIAANNILNALFMVLAAGLAIGLTLVVIHIVGIQVTGVSVNPARSIGPAVFVGGTAIAQL